MSTKLIFVYNAKSNFWNKKIDFAHKIVSPSTYKCDLCALTHGNFGETEIWKNFREHSNFDMEFIYKDQFEKLYPNINTLYPVVFKKTTLTQLETMLNYSDLAKIETVEELIKLF